MTIHDVSGFVDRLDDPIFDDILREYPESEDRPRDAATICEIISRYREAKYWLGR